MRSKPCLASVCLCVTLSSLGCGEPAADPDPARPVRVMRVGDWSVMQGRVFPGRARAKAEVDLAFQVSGPLISLSVDVGTELQQGDVIAAIEPRDFQVAVDSAEGNLARAQAQLLAMERGARPEEIEQLRAAVAEAEASLRQAVAEHERNESLLPSGAVSQSMFDLTLARRDRMTAQLDRVREELNMGMIGSREEDLLAQRAEIRSLEAAARNAANQLDDAVLRAPFAGTVAARFVDNFQVVTARQPVVRIVDVSRIEITVQVPESLIALVPSVQRAICRFDALPGREFEGHVTRVGSEASQVTRTFPVTVEVAQPEDVRILPGMAGTVSAERRENESADSALVVPPGALFAATAGPASCVWVVDPDSETVVRRPVTTGQLTPVGVAVTGGLERGEWVVTAGVRSLVENQPVRILEEGSR
jgi:RND family efflux transporter MFP subunit